jgi:hypothetical protein
MILLWHSILESGYRFEYTLVLGEEVSTKTSPLS